MAKIDNLTMMKLEGLLGMSNGNLLDFSHASLNRFIMTSVDEDIESDRYHYESNSKANKLRGFIHNGTANKVGKLINDLLDRFVESRRKYDNELSVQEQEYLSVCKRYADSLINNLIVENIDALDSDDKDEDFTKLKEGIKDYIDKNKPEEALDRLHTYLMKYYKKLCTKHKVSFGDSDTLNSLASKYSRYIKEVSVVESRVTYKILGSSVQILELFNKVRNDHSFAHDNQLLNYHESLLIFNNICNTVNFINLVEESIII